MNGEWGKIGDITSFVSTLFPPLSESEKMHLRGWMTEIPVFAEHARC